jgi:hypothetical protein
MSREIASPRGVDPARNREHVLRLLVQARTGEHPAHLHLLSEREQVGLDAEMIVGPEPAGQPDPCLHLVEHEQRLVLVGKAPQLAQELDPEVIVAALGLYRLDDDRRDVVLPLRERGLDLIDRLPFHLPDTLDLGGRHREADRRVDDTRPVEHGEVLILARIGRIGHRQRVAGPPVERLAEVDHLVTLLLPVSLPEVPAHLPVHSRLQRVLYAERSTRDEEGVRQVGRDADAREGVEKLGELGRVDVGVARVRERRPEKLRAETGFFHLRVIEPERQRGEERKDVEVRSALPRVPQSPAAALLEVENDVEPVREHVSGNCLVHARRRDACAFHRSPPAGAGSM